jgi:hypothetical protein
VPVDRERHGTHAVAGLAEHVEEELPGGRIEGEQLSAYRAPAGVVMVCSQSTAPCCGVQAQLESADVPLVVSLCQTPTMSLSWSTSGALDGVAASLPDERRECPLPATD